MAISPVLIDSLPCAKQYVLHLNDTLKSSKASAGLTACQCTWLITVLVGILVTGTLNWAAYERRSLKVYRQSRLRWMFYHAKIAWPLLLQSSIGYLLMYYAIHQGVLIIDDTDKRRSKRTMRIAGAHKVKDKKTGGYFNGQELIFLVLVTDVVTIPVAFRWYTPDPALSAWRQENRRLKALGMPAEARPRKPNAHPGYPTKQALAQAMLREFTARFPGVRIQSVLADALYGTGEFMDLAASVTGNAQIVSQLRSNQLVFSRGRKVDLATYFSRQAGAATLLPIRGGEKKQVTMLAARLPVKAHGICDRLEIRRGDGLPVSGGFGPVLAPSGHRRVVYLEVARGGFHSGLEVPCRLEQADQTPGHRGVDAGRDPEPAVRSSVAAASDAIGPTEEQATRPVGGLSHRVHQGRSSRGHHGSHRSSRRPRRSPQGIHKRDTGYPGGTIIAQTPGRR